MIDEDQSGTLVKDEVVTAVQTKKDVMEFLSNCGNANLQYLCVPSRLAQALAVVDTDGDGEITITEWESAIETALKAKLEQARARREAQAAADRRELEAFTEECGAARSSAIPPRVAATRARPLAATWMSREPRRRRSRDVDIP